MEEVEMGEIETEMGEIDTEMGEINTQMLYMHNTCHTCITSIILA